METINENAVVIDIATRMRELRIAQLRTELQNLGVRELDDLRKELELPPEALGWMIERFEATGKKNSPTDRHVLPINTGAERVRPGQSAVITARPQRTAFRPERVHVSDACSEYRGPWWKRLSPWYRPPQPRGASDWMINDIVIGNRSQFAQSGAIPADMFRSSSIDSFVTFETAQTAMDVKFVVTYIGPNHKGERFYASMIGSAVP